MIVENTGTLAWHWLADDRLMRFGGRQRVEAGHTYTADGPLELCANGMHASIRPLDALEYATGVMICRVRVSGEIVHGADKLVARHRHVLWIADASRVLHEFAIWCAEQALTRCRERGNEPHAASWRALEVKRLWLDGKATDAELDAAWAAARTAAWDAARTAARTAAWAAARTAARTAAWDAARTAAWDAARTAARTAAWAAENTEFERRLLALAPATGGE